MRKAQLFLVWAASRIPSVSAMSRCALVDIRSQHALAKRVSFPGAGTSAIVIQVLPLRRPFKKGSGQCLHSLPGNQIFDTQRTRDVSSWKDTPDLTLPANSRSPPKELRTIPSFPSVADTFPAVKGVHSRKVFPPLSMVRLSLILDLDGLRFPELRLRPVLLSPTDDEPVCSSRCYSAGIAFLQNSSLRRFARTVPNP